VTSDEWGVTSQPEEAVVLLVARHCFWGPM